MRTEEKKEGFWKKLTKYIPEPVKRFLTGTALFLTSQAASASPAEAPNAEKSFQVLDPIETFEHYKNNSSPIGIITYFETNGSGANGNIVSAARISTDKRYLGLIQMDKNCRKEYYNTLKNVRK